MRFLLFSQNSSFFHYIWWALNFEICLIWGFVNRSRNVRLKTPSCSLISFSWRNILLKSRIPSFIIYNFVIANFNFIYKLPAYKFGLNSSNDTLCEILIKFVSIEIYINLDQHFWIKVRWILWKAKPFKQFDIVHKIDEIKVTMAFSLKTSRFE